MKTPTMQELIEYLDGTLHPSRYQELDIEISKSPRLQKEIALLKAMQKIVRNDTAATPSRKFTAHVMKEILPLHQETYWMRILKNSSNLFAMALVLSMIGMVLVWSPSSSSGNSLLSKSFESYSTTYNTTLDSFTAWTKQYMHPVNQAAKTSSGKFLFIGVFAFFIFVIVDEYFGKRNISHRIKH